MPESYFFEQADCAAAPSAVNSGFQAITDALSTPEGIRIARPLSKIEDGNTRRRIADLLEAIIADRKRKVA